MSENPSVKALYDIQRSQINNSIALLEFAEQIAAIKAALFSLDSRAQALFELRLKEMRSSNQEKREELSLLLQMHDPTGGNVH